MPFLQASQSWFFYADIDDLAGYKLLEKSEVRRQQLELLLQKSKNEYANLGARRWASFSNQRRNPLCD